MSSSGGENLSMKVLQLQCIVDAKDRELQILREKASQDPEVPAIVVLCELSCGPIVIIFILPFRFDFSQELLEQLRQENAALQEQLQQSQAGAAHGRASRKGDKDSSRRGASSSNGGNADRLLHLNVSGTAMHVPLSVVMQVGDAAACWHVQAVVELADYARLS